MTLPAGDADGPEVHMEHRWGTRICCAAQVQVSCGEVVQPGRVRNLSVSGAFIETALRLPLNSHVDVAVTDDGSGKPGKPVPACVVRVGDDGLAVEWFDSPTGSICGAIGCTGRCAAAVAAGQCR